MIRLESDRFWEKVEIGRIEDCWLWTAGTNSRGYGKLLVMREGTRKLRSAHRLMFEACYGPIPRDKPVVMHSCDNPLCVNPLHLTAGTMAENIHDRDAKGRTAKQVRPKKWPGATKKEREAARGRANYSSKKRHERHIKDQAKRGLT